jgi:uncharacterized Ntn-hydrolase superfamily protein
MTFSIAARCAQTGMLGVAIASSSIAVGSRCAWARAGVGAVLTQNVTNPALGAIALDLLAEGLSASQTIAALLEREAYPDYRQLLAIDRQGNTAQHTGQKALGIHNQATGVDCIAAGNLLANPAIPSAMIEAFSRQQAALAVRLLSALQAALQAGGEQGPVRSAALLVVDREPWAIVDLRVDWDDAPIETLHHLWTVYEPQLSDYVTRAHHPEAAPSYGVAGDP